MPKVVDWWKICDDFHEGLILGNGASIATHQGFAYQSLLEEARKRQFISESAEAVFDHLCTQDFERVLRMLWHASRINKALGVKDRRTTETYESIRSALVKTVTRIHPIHTAINATLPQIAKFLKRFKTVVSLNYDLLIYWAILWANERCQNRFKDCFIHGEFDSSWEDYRSPYGSAARSTLVFYPHGNLALATNLDGDERKLNASIASSLLDTIQSEWQSGKYSPLFVSEGTSKQKIAAIRRSPYLKTVYKSVLPKLGKRVATVGWSLSQSDKHILQAIGRGELTEIAVSVLTSKPRLEEKCAAIKRKIENASTRRTVKVIFFDAKSEGCWINAPYRATKVGRALE
ncbi:MAG: DUF4917 family protein [Nitrospira sp.]|nr:DUF4917 family protein [Nitrospira sp.]